MSTKEFLSKKQCAAIKEATARINIWQGAIRSGKTYSSLLKFLQLIRTGPPGHVMIIGATRDSIQRNILTELAAITGARVPGSKATEMNFFGRKVYFVGANDESAVRRIQGSTLALAYVDECTVIPRAFWNMLLGRLSVPGAQLLGTCNPEGPLHWLKKDFIDRAEALALLTWKFELSDNPVLTKEYVDNLKIEYTGVWYKRFILGEWAIASGLVFEGVDEDNIYIDTCSYPDTWVAGVDYGTTNPTVCLLAGMTPKKWPQIRIEGEYYYDSVKAGRQKSDAQLVDDIEDFLGNRLIEAIYVDPSAASLHQEMLCRGLPVLAAENDVVPGLRVTQKFLSQKNIVINKKCNHLYEELLTYSWDQKAAERGKDQPLKQNDHCSDALRYLIYSLYPEGEIVPSGSSDEDLENVKRMRRYVI